MGSEHDETSTGSDSTPESPRLPRATNRWRKVERYVSLAAEAGAIAMSLRDRPTRLDWLGVGLRVLGLANRVRTEHRHANAGNPWSYFDEDDGRWRAIPDELRKLVLEHVTDARLEPGYWNGELDAYRVYLGSVGGETVGWVQDNRAIADGPYLLAARAAHTYRALGERLWRKMGSPHLAYGRAGLTVDAAAVGRLVPTEQLRLLERRAAEFLAHRIPRSFLLLGPPGTGKSAGIRLLVDRLGLRSLRVDLRVLAERHQQAEDISASLEALLELLRPEALILDDLDRVPMEGHLLHFLEQAARTCRLVMASANCADRMLGAALRPGRFDELVRVDRLDPAVLRELLGGDADLADELADLPVAYVADFVKRRQVLGRAQALAELADLRARRVLVDQRTDDGD